MMLNISVKNEPNKRASVVVKKNGDIITDMWTGSWRLITDPQTIDRVMAIKQKGFLVAGTDPEWISIRGLDYNAVSTAAMDAAATSTYFSSASPVKEVSKSDLVTKWLKFFSEFNFKPQIRFINSIARLTKVDDVRAYVIGYFELTNNSYAADIAEKTKSKEFTDLAGATCGLAQKAINTRLEIYYGDPGSGKTTLSIMNNPGAEVVLCHPSMTPDELFRGFDFEDGKPVFKGCPLRRAMEEGKVVILDEINLLTEDCRRALQAITDTKREVVINTDHIEIKDGFKVIGTMNLQVGDMTYPLPEPLVDRAEVIRRFSMDADDIAALAF